MKSIVLITDKKTQEKMICSFDSDKEIVLSYNPRMYFNEVLERVRDNVDERIQYWREYYKIEIIKLKKRRPTGLKYNCDPEASKRKSELMKKNNPSYTNWINNEERKQKQSDKMKGNQISVGPKPEHWKQWMSEWMKQYTCVKGYKWIYNPTTDKETRIPPGTPLPEGYRYGRNIEIINMWLNRDYWY